MTKLLIVFSDLAKILTNTCLLTASVSDLLRLSGVISFLGLQFTAILLSRHLRWTRNGRWVC